MSARAWVAAMRPPTLAAAIAPVAVGSAIAFREHTFRAGPALAALLGAIAIQIGTNFANDVYDAEKGADTSARLGPLRAVAAGLIGARAMKRAMVAAFLVAIAFGVYLTSAAGPVVACVGAASIAAGVAYTAGPWALAYLGLGDLFVIVFFGFVAVAGTTFVQTGALSTLSLAAAIPIGALAAAILVINNVRDRAGDRAANKRTLVVRFGRAFAVAEHAALCGASYLVPIAWWLVHDHAPVLLPLLTLPLAVRIHLDLRRRDGRALNLTLRQSGALLLAFGALFALGLVLGEPWAA